MGIFRCLRRGYHVYIDNEEWTPAIIGASENSFRILDGITNDKRRKGEKIYLNAGYKTLKCRYCGREETEWIKDIRKKLPTVKEDGTVIL